MPKIQGSTCPEQSLNFRNLKHALGKTELGLGAANGTPTPAIQVAAAGYCESERAGFCNGQSKITVLLQLRSTEPRNAGVCRFSKTRATHQIRKVSG